MNDRAKLIDQLNEDMRVDDFAPAYILGYISVHVPTEALKSAHESFLRHQAAIENVLRARSE